MFTLKEFILQIFNAHKVYVINSGIAKYEYNKLKINKVREKIVRDIILRIYFIYKYKIDVGNPYILLHKDGSINQAIEPVCRTDNTALSESDRQIVICKAADMAKCGKFRGLQ